MPRSSYYAPHFKKNQFDSLFKGFSSSYQMAWGLHQGLGFLVSLDGHVFVSEVQDWPYGTVVLLPQTVLGLRGQLAAAVDPPGSQRWKPQAGPFWGGLGVARAPCFRREICSAP